MSAVNQSTTSTTSTSNNLFIEAKKGTAVLLVDTSGSTSTTFDRNTGLTVFDKFAQIAGSLGHPNYRVIFWSSPGYNSGAFANGIMKLDFVVKPGTLHAVFASVSKFIGGGTCPSLGFRAITPEWINDESTVYLLTDGQIGCGERTDGQTKSELVAEIRALHCKLCILAVETVTRDFNQVEAVQSAAGGDVYKLIQDNKLTSIVSQFISYNPSGKFVQINKNKAPPAHAPYGDKYFSELRIGEFINFIATELKSKPDETSQLEIAQNLSVTLEYLTRDKPVRLADDIVRTFSNMFVLDAGLVRFILTSAISKERSGQSAVFANYRAQLKDLFKQADNLIKTDVCEAVGMTDKFVSYLIENRVLTGSYRLADKSLTIHGNRYPRSAFGNVPVFPMLGANTRLTELQEQCLRQWTRCVYGAFYRVHPTNDEVIYLVLGNVLKVAQSNVGEHIKTAYRQLGKIMLHKKRLNSVQTELNRIEQGEFPTPNSGKVEDFYVYMRAVALKLNIYASPLKLWFEICRSLDPNIGAKQQRHCTAELGTEFKIEHVFDDYIPESSTLDYECIVTLEDISAIGGYHIMAHTSPAGSQCSPVYLVSEEGYNGMIARNLACPVCYARLTENNFERVGPKVNFALPASYNAYASRFAEQAIAGYGSYATSNTNGNAGQSNTNNRNNTSSSYSQGRNNTGQSNTNNQNNRASVRNANNKPGTLVVLKGVVGAGKSTYAQKILEAVLARGGHCIIEGTDKYCKNGMDTRSAVQMVKNALEEVKNVTNDDLVVVVDTCGEQTQDKQMAVFGVNFDGWKKVTLWPNLNRADMKGYFAWSLRNVLMRGQVVADSNFYLTPTSAGIQVCINVHKKKAKALFPKKIDLDTWVFDNATASNLDGLADEYIRALPAFVMPNGV